MSIKQGGNLPRYICHTCYGADAALRLVTINGPDLSLEMIWVRLETFGSSRSDVRFRDDDDRGPGPCIVPLLFLPCRTFTGQIP